MEKGEHLYTVGRNVNWYSHNGKRMEVSKKKKLPYDPAIPLLSIHPLTHRDICPTMFTVALYATAKIWKQTKCPSNR